MKKTAASLIIHRNKILLLLRDDNPKIPDPNKWQSIGGYVEEGESFDEAIRREIEEETHLKPKNIQYYGILKGKDYISAVYLCFLTDDEVKQVKLGNEGQELKFFTLEEIRKLDVSITIRTYLEKYLLQLEKIIKGETVATTEFGLEL